MSDLPTVDELSSAGLIDSSTINSSIFALTNFKDQTVSKEENIYSDIENAIDQANKSEE